MPGKADWLARGLPREGAKAAEPRAIEFARQDAVTCHRTDALAAVRPRVEASPYGFALVVEGGILIGRLRKAALENDTNATAEDAMDPGPSTVRADTDPERLRERLDRQHVTSAVITDPDGRLLGVVRRADLPERSETERPSAREG